MNYAPERTGIAPYTAGMAEMLAARGDRVRVLTTFPHYPEWRFTDGTTARRSRSLMNGVDVIRLRHSLPEHGSSLSRVWSELTFGLRALVQPWDAPDAVVLVSPAMFASAVLAVRARLSRKPVVTWVQDLYGPGVREMSTGDRFGLSERLVEAVEGALLRGSTGVSVIHQKMVEGVVALGVDPAKVGVVRNWSHLQLVSHLGRARMRERLGWRPDETIVLHTGNMGVKQDLPNTIEAARIAGERDLPIRFVLMGDGATRAKLEEQAQGVDRMSIRDAVPASQYLDVLRAADVLLVNEHPRLMMTALPSKLTSYYASGRPVIAATAADSTTATEVERSGAGVRVDPADPAAMVEAVQQLIAEPMRMKRMAEAGRRHRAEHLTQEAAVQSFAALLDRVTNRSSGHVPPRSPSRTGAMSSLTPRRGHQRAG